MFKGNFVLDEKDETNEGPLIFSPWSLPWTYPTPHSPLSPEIASSSSGLPLSDPGVRAEFVQVVYKMVFWPCLCRQKQYYGCQMHFINRNSHQFPTSSQILWMEAVQGGPLKFTGTFLPCTLGTPLKRTWAPEKNLWSSLTDKYQSFRSSNSGALRFQDEETNFIKMLEDFKKNRR